MGLGYWTRSNTEVCLLATRGKPKRVAPDVRQGIIAKAREHSRKPDGIHERIERLVSGPYLELFARQRRPNWDCWGNETDKFVASGAEEYNEGLPRHPRAHGHWWRGLEAMTDTDRAVDDIRYLPWENKRPPKRQRKPLVRLITICDLEPHHCRWPTSGPPWAFCGEPKAEGRPYCVDHTRIAYHKGLRT